MIQLKVNGAEQSFGGDPNMPLLWYLRDVAGLTGAKFVCRDGVGSRIGSPAGPTCAMPTDADGSPCCNSMLNAAVVSMP